MSQGLSVYDRHERLELFNHRFAEIFRLPETLLRPGTLFRDMLAGSLAVGNFPGRLLDEVYLERKAFIARGEAARVIQTLGDGRVIAISHEPMPDGGWVATFEDITEQRRIEAQIRFMAQHDTLTGLPNRALFIDRMEQALAFTQRGERFALLHLDLDQFQSINETLGHQIGDQLLQAVADRLRTCVRETDTIARLGGDEFAIIQTRLRHPEEAELLASRLVEAIGVPFDLGGHRVVTTVSIGVALAPGNGTVSDDLLKHADMALNRAKADGRATLRFFEAEMDERMQTRRALEAALRHAMENEEFELYYQPILDITSCQPTCCEALIRWNHPERGMVSPAEFIPLAEEIGLIGPLGAWVLRQACKDAMGWPGHIRVAVNVSPIQFKSEQLVAIVRQALDLSGLPPSRLELEITESILLQNNAANLATLHELRALGAHIALDDFGTGYSSLSYLRCFPFDTIKIDQSFVREISEKADCRAIVHAITGLGRSLSMNVVAEGVETQGQLENLRDAACQDVQGFLFSRPRPAREIAGLIGRFCGQVAAEERDVASAM